MSSSTPLVGGTASGKTPAPLKAWRLPSSVQLTLVIGIAVISGFTASVGAYRFLKERATMSLQANSHMAPLVVARQDLSPGDTIGFGAVEVMPWPANLRPNQAFSSIQEVQSRVVKTAIFRGEPIGEGRLVAQGDRAGLQVRIPAGYLAMSIKVDPEIGVSGFIQPGNRVDVVATLRLAGNTSMTKVVLQRLLVLAVEHRTEQLDERPTDATTVTLAVTSEEAEKLALASREGQIMLALRNMRDEHEHETPGFSVAELARLGGVSMAPTVTASPPMAVASAPPVAAPSTPLPEPVMADTAALSTPVPEPLPMARYHVVQLIEGESSSEVKFELP